MTEFQEALIAGFYMLLLLAALPVSVSIKDSIVRREKEVKQNDKHNVGEGARQD